MAGSASANSLIYNYTTTLSLQAGPDILGLDGALLSITVDVDSGAVYIDRFGYPSVIMNNDATLTISGSSIPSNNGTFAFPQLAFYPSFAGLFTDPAGADPVVSLPVGGSLTFALNSNATLTGSSALVGNTIDILDFGPATSRDSEFGGDSAQYGETNTNITVSMTSATPEPGSLALVLSSLAGLSLLVRRKRG